MNDTVQDEGTRHVRSKKPLVPILFLSYLSELFVRSMKKNLKVIAREADLFVGTAFLALGLLGFNSGKYCDGNTADYLSCTRPSTYYYYGVLDIVLVILGIAFILFWYFKKKGE